MRVLLTNDLPPDTGGGAEVHLERLVRGLEAAGDRVEVFTATGERRGVGRVLDLWDPWSRQRLSQLAARFRPDVVHHHNVVRELSVSVLGVPVGVPAVLTVHDARLLGTADGELTGLRRTVDRTVKSRLDLAVARRRVAAAVAVSSPLAARLRATGFRRVLTVPALTERPRLPLRPVGESHDLLFAGRLSADKGVLVLLAAFEQVARRHPRARLLVAGDGPLAAEVHARAGTLPRVELLGRLDQHRVQQLMARVRAVVVPSLPTLRPEGCGLTALEAACHGRALVTSDDPGLVEVAARTGAVVTPAGDAPALAAALDRLLGSPGWSQRCAAAAAAGAARWYDPDVVLGRLRALHADLAGGRGRAAA